MEADAQERSSAMAQRIQNKVEADVMATAKKSSAGAAATGGGVQASAVGGAVTVVKRDAPLAAAMKEMQADAPACDVCGTITVRSGTCYKCLNCGNSMGCS